MRIARNKKRYEHRSMHLTIAQIMMCITSKEIFKTYTEAHGWNKQYAQQSKVELPVHKTCESHCDKKCFLVTKNKIKVQQNKKNKLRSSAKA